MLPQIVEMAEAGAGVDLISRALGIGAEVVHDALHLHRTGRRPPGRDDGRRRKPRQPGKPFVPKYQKMATAVDRRRKAGENFDRLAREMKVSRGTVVRAYDHANRDEAAAAAAEVPDSARRNANAICSSVKCFFPIQKTHPFR